MTQAITPLASGAPHRDAAPRANALDKPGFRWVMRAIGIFMIVGGAALAWMQVGLIRTGYASEDWPIAQGQLQKLDVKDTGSSGFSGNYEALLQYTYTVDGREYAGTRLRVAPKKFLTETSARLYVGEFVYAPKLKVHYNGARTEPADARRDVGRLLLASGSHPDSARRPAARGRDNQAGETHSGDRTVTP